MEIEFWIQYDYDIETAVEFEISIADLKSATLSSLIRKYAYSGLTRLERKVARRK